MSCVITHPLWHDDDVAGLHEEVVLINAVGDLPVIERHADCRRPVLPEHDDAIARGEIGEALSERDHLEHGHRTLQLEAAGCLHCAHDGNLPTVHLADHHGHFRCGNEVREPFSDLFAQRRRRQPGGLDVVHERQRYLAVGTHWYGATELRVLPDGDVEDVFGSDLKRYGAHIARVPGRDRRAGARGWRSG